MDNHKMVDKIMEISRIQFAKSLFIITLVMIISGCAVDPLILKTTKERVYEAQEHLETVENLKAEEAYPYDFKKAKKELTQAKQYLEKEKLEKALPAAENSLTASKDILRRYYLDDIARKADALKRTIREKVGDDADSPLKDYIPELNEILDFAEDLEKGQQIASLDKVMKSLDACLKIQDSTESYRSEKLESDVSFEIGRYDLSDKGIRILEQEFLTRIIADKDYYSRQSPDGIVTIKIKVVGYTDQVGFNEKRPLFRELTDGVEYDLPRHHPERRQFLNQRLSEFRARAISNYIRQAISETEMRTSRVNVESEGIGRGEDIPPGVFPSGLTNDPQRRICKIYSHYRVVK